MAFVWLSFVLFFLFFCLLINHSLISCSLFLSSFALISDQIHSRRRRRQERNASIHRSVGWRVADKHRTSDSGGPQLWRHFDNGLLQRQWMWVRITITRFYCNNQLLALNVIDINKLGLTWIACIASAVHPQHWYHRQLWQLLPDAWHNP